MSALALRIIASICMLLDHIGYFFDIHILRLVGRLAFPLYVFLMVNGFRHTKSRTKYASRFAVFAVISQIPFLMLSNCYLSAQEFFQKLAEGPSFWLSHMNVMITLLLGLLVIWSGEALRNNKKTRYLCLFPAALAFFAYFFGFIHSDYGSKGIVMAVVFWLFEDRKLWMSIGMFFAVFHGIFIQIALYFLKTQELLIPAYWDCVQILSLLALPIIFSYNGKPGRLPSAPVAKKSMQLGFYAFYPAHMLLLWLIA